MSARAVPFHCPYCGDVELRPHEVEDGPSHGTWECRSCLRAFRLTMIGQLRHPSTMPTEITAPTRSETPR